MSLQHSGLYTHSKITGKSCIPAATLLAGTISTFVQNILTTLAEGSVQQKTNVTPIADGAVKEITPITCVADVAGNLAGKYFLVSSPTVNYAYWYKVSGVGSSPAVGGATNVEIDITTGATGPAVAAATATVVNAQGGAGTIFSVPAPGAAIITITAVKYGVHNAAAGAGTSGFTVGSVTAGVNSALTGKYWLISSKTVSYYLWYNVTGLAAASSDPAPGGTGIQVTIAGGANLATVLSATEAALNAQTGIFTATGAVAPIVVTNVVYGVANAASTAGNSGFTVTTATVGHATVLSGTDIYLSEGGTNYYLWYNVTGLSSTDPAPGGKTSITVTLAQGDSANTVALKTYNALIAVGAGDVFYAEIPAANVLEVQDAENNEMGIAITDGAVPTGFTDATSSSKGTIIGTDTDFSLIDDDGFIYDATNCELRQVLYNFNIPATAGNVNQRIDLVSPFTNALVNASLYWVPNKSVYKIDLINEGAGDALINGLGFPALNPQPKHYFNDLGLNPIAVDGTGTSIDVEFWYS